jgi:MFS family permease
MLLDAARIARIASAATDPVYLQRKAKAAAVSSAAWVAAGAFAFVAVVFALIAAYLGLQEAMPAWAAALVVAAIAVILAGIAMLVARRRGRRVPLPHAAAARQIRPHPERRRHRGRGPRHRRGPEATRARPGETVLLAIGIG